MLLRLLLALLVAALPLPATASAACHAPPAAATAAMAHHGAPARHEPARQPAAEMLCMGCVAPATVHAPMLAAPIGFAAPRSPRIALTGVPLAATPPATPPPRSGA